MPKKRTVVEEQVNGVLNGSPWWVKTIAYLGFPIFVAMILLGIIVGYVPSTLTALADTTKKLEQSITDHRKDTADIAASVTVNIRLQRAICRNTAKTDLERLACDQ